MATDDEVEAEMKNVADKYGMDLDTVKKYLRPEEVKEQVIREKVIKVVADSAKAVAPAEEKAELEAEGEIVEKPPRSLPPRRRRRRPRVRRRPRRPPPRSLRLRRPPRRTRSNSLYTREKRRRGGVKTFPPPPRALMKNTVGWV